MVLTHLCKSELENSEKASLHLPGRLVSICPRGVYLANPNINPSGTISDQTIQKHKQTTVYLCPGKGKATLEIDIQIRKGTLCF